MEKKIRKVLIIISIIIFIFGVINIIMFKNGLSNNKVDSNIYVDGTNATPFINAFNELGSSFISILLFAYFILGILAFWIMYFVVLGIIKLIKKIKNKHK